MKIYLWVLHLGGFTLAFILGLEVDRGTWPASILCALTSVTALAVLAANKLAEKRAEA